ncbi:hypothetical protein BN2476_520066 [Paraburkholderia piptadeniae]|uniref:Aldehyde dehydrogenase domain-containing protein n=1 Tax=Paraburkholderia piptadeniae TaxID=1701573 RepID=A0A1N7SI78_9BURK|nr:hypothetical protein BN2476_520066 [Paraburkholderia piptadeniae]
MPHPGATPPVTQSQLWRNIKVRLSRDLEAGMVIMNSGSVGTDSVPFGGVKQSGYGREGSHYGIEEYVHVKYTLMSGLA